MKKDKHLPYPADGPAHVTIANFERMDKVWAKVRKAGLYEDVRFLIDFAQKDVVHCLKLEGDCKAHETQERTKELVLN